MQWRDFRTERPYDCFEDEKNNLETDPMEAWFVYRYFARPGEGRLFVSYRACTFRNGVFEGYESHMKTSPYPEDRIEVVAWIPSREVKQEVMESFNRATV